MKQKKMKVKPHISFIKNIWRKVSRVTEKAILVSPWASSFNTWRVLIKIPADEMKNKYNMSMFVRLPIQIHTFIALFSFSLSLSYVFSASILFHPKKVIWGVKFHSKSPPFSVLEPTFFESVQAWIESESSTGNILQVSTFLKEKTCFWNVFYFGNWEEDLIEKELDRRRKKKGSLTNYIFLMKNSLSEWSRMMN